MVSLWASSNYAFLLYDYLISLVFNIYFVCNLISQKLQSKVMN